MGHSPEAIVTLTLAELGCLPVDDEGEKLVRRYLDRRAVVGPSEADAPAFVDTDGARLKPDGFSAYVSRLRRVGVNAEFNGALCRGLQTTNSKKVNHIIIQTREKLTNKINIA